LIAAFALAAIAATASLALSAGQLRRVRAAPSSGVVALVAAVRRAPPSERVAMTVRLARPGSWEAALASELADARSGDEAAEVIDAALSDLERGLVRVRGWSGAALRVGVLGGLLGGALAVIQGLWIVALAAAGLGALGALLAGFVGLRAGSLEAEQRRRADDLVTALVGGRAGPSPGVARGRRPALDRQAPDR
jgi:hypothetical protein